MNTELIKDLCIKGSKAYFDYLLKSGRGLNEVDVWGIDVIDRTQRLLRIRLSKKIFDTEALTLRILGDTDDVLPDHFTVIEYEAEKSTLYLEAKPDLFFRLSTLRAAQVKVIADMKFLVERVSDWFSKKGEYIQLPTNVSPLAHLANNFPFIPPLQPSSDQVDAVQTALTQPISYIWGAPGTGKTQMVLANIIVQYVKQNKRCLILAPTNTALEQVLRGVIRLSDAAGIPRDKFLRLGHTSKAFAEQFSEVCEAHGIQSQRMQVERQISVLKNLMRKENVAAENLVQPLEEAAEKMMELKVLYQTATEKKTAQKLIKALLKETGKLLAKAPQTKTMGAELDADTLEPTLIYTQNLIVQFKRDEAVLQSRATELSSLPDSELKEMLNELEQSRDKMTVSNERAKKANIIAATLDGYIYRFVEDELNVDHIFLDEAGYACAIKAMPLFKGNVPVTFLGDHKQLPPVCEMNDMDMQAEDKQPVFIWSKSAIHLFRLFEQTEEEAFLSYMNNQETLSNKLARADLRHTHRFGAQLAEVLNQYVYQNGFGSNQERGETEIYVVDTSSAVPQPRNQYEKPTRESEEEVFAIRQFLQTNPLSDFAIITPYVNQVKILGKALPSERSDGRIMTVHASQGKEWDNVILSVVDTDKKWFTDTRSEKSRGLFLINTAVSRARKRLIIFCNAPYWKKQNGQLIKGLLDVAEPWHLL
jgi:hypothetical protein